MIKIKGHNFTELKKFGKFIDTLRDEDGHIELKVRACHEHGLHTISNEVGQVITEENIGRVALCEIYYLDECENYPEYVFVCMNGTIIVAQDMLHYGVY